MTRRLLIQCAAGLLAGAALAAAISSSSRGWLSSSSGDAGGEKPGAGGQGETTAGDESLARLVEKMSLRQKVDPQDEIKLRGAIDRWIKRDPVAALNWLHEHQLLTLVSTDQIGAVILAAADGDLNRAIALAQKLSSPFCRDSALRHAFTERFLSDPPKALELIKYCPVAMRHRLTLDLVKRWVLTDGHTAVNSLLENPAVNDSIVDQALMNWAGKAPAQAYAALVEAGKGSRKLECGEALVKYMAILKPERAAELYVTLPAGLRSPGALTTLLETIAQRDPAHFAAIISREDVSLKELSAATAVAAERIKTNADNVEWFAGLLPAERSRTEAYRKAAEAKARQDVRGAAEWANGLTDSFARDAAFREVAAEWTFNRPAAGFEYALSHDPGWIEAMLDSVRRTFDSRSAVVDQTGSWAADLTQPAKERLSAIIRVLPEGDSVKRIGKYLESNAPTNQ